MSRGYTPRHAQTAGDLGVFPVQFNAETLWHFGRFHLGDKFEAKADSK